MAVPPAAAPPSDNLYMPLIPGTVEEQYVETYAVREPTKKPAPLPPPVQSDNDGDAYVLFVDGPKKDEPTSVASGRQKSPAAKVPSPATNVSAPPNKAVPPSQPAPQIEEFYEDMTTTPSAPKPSIPAPQIDEFYVEVDVPATSAPKSSVAPQPPVSAPPDQANQLYELLDSPPSSNNQPTTEQFYEDMSPNPATSSSSSSSSSTVKGQSSGQSAPQIEEFYEDITTTPRPAPPKPSIPAPQIEEFYEDVSSATPAPPKPSMPAPEIDECYVDVEVPSTSAPKNSKGAPPQAEYMMLNQASKNNPADALYTDSLPPSSVHRNRAASSSVERPKSVSSLPPALPPGHPANKPQIRMANRPLPPLPVARPAPAPPTSAVKRQQSTPSIPGNSAAPQLPPRDSARKNSAPTTGKITTQPKEQQRPPAQAGKPKKQQTTGQLSAADKSLAAQPASQKLSPQHHTQATSTSPSAKPVTQRPASSSQPLRSSTPAAAASPQKTLQSSSSSSSISPPPSAPPQAVVQQQQQAPRPPQLQQQQAPRPPQQVPRPAQQMPRPAQQMPRPPQQMPRPPQQMPRPPLQAPRAPTQQVPRAPLQQQPQQRVPASYPQPPPQQYPPYQAPPHGFQQAAPCPPLLPSSQPAQAQYQPPPSYQQAMAPPTHRPPHSGAAYQQPVGGYQYQPRFPPMQPQQQQRPPMQPQMYPGYPPPRPPVRAAAPPQQPPQQQGYQVPVGYNILDSFAKDNVVLLIPLIDPNLWPVRADGGKLKGGGSFTQNESLFTVVVPRKEEDHVVMFKCYSSKNYISINKKDRFVTNGNADSFSEFNIRVVTPNSSKVRLESVKFPRYFLAVNPDGSAGDPKLVGASSKECHFIVRVQKFAPPHTMLSNPMVCGRPSVTNQLRDRSVVQLQCGRTPGFLAITKRGVVEESRPTKPNAPMDKNTQLMVYNRGMGIYSFRSYKHTENWIRIKGFQVEGSGDPNLNADFCLKEAPDGSICLESLTCPGTHVTVLAGQQLVTSFRIVPSGQQT